jgi:NAD(P)-dependent dehydrogenase (short-subunit alcohol dehydrogenase family)
MEACPVAQKRAAVTGGDRGIGLGIAARLAGLGAEVCLIARNVEHLDSARARITAAGGACETITADLADLAATERAAGSLLALSPRWDILVNCAGNPPGPTLLEMSAEYWNTTFAVHCRAPFLLARALAPGMIAAGGGRILNISSVASFVAVRGHGAYSPAKAALNMLTREMAVEWGPHIQANAICPTATLTEMGQEVWGSHPAQAAWLRAKTPAGRFAEVDEIVDFAIFLLGPSARYVNGASIPIDGGLLAGYSDGPPPG